MAANVTTLRRMPGIDANDTATKSLGFVFEESFELREAPRVKSSFGFAASLLNSLSNVRQVLNHYGCTRLNVFQNALAQNVIAVASEAHIGSREASKAPFGGLRTFRLQGSLQTEAALDDFSPMFLTMYSPIGCDSWARNAQVNTECGSPVDKLNSVKFQDDMKNESSFVVNKVGGCRFVADKCFRIFGNRERNLLSTAYRSKVHNAIDPIDLEGMQIKPRRTKRCCWTINLATLLAQCDRRLNRLCGLLTRLNVKVGHKIRQRIFNVSISQLVQREGIPFMQPPTFRTHVIERLRKLAHRLQQDFTLFRCWFQRQPQRSVHSFIIRYNSMKLQTK
jgi:hypothetical protein